MFEHVVIGLIAWTFFTNCPIEVEFNLLIDKSSEENWDGAAPSCVLIIQGHDSCNVFIGRMDQDIWSIKVFSAGP